MTVRRSSLGQLMVLVGILAADLAVCRYFVAPTESFAQNLARWVPVVPMGVVVQAALFVALTASGRVRAFGAGFAAGGMLALGFAFGALVDPPRETYTFSASGIVPLSTYRGAPTTRLIYWYEGAVFQWLEDMNYPYLFPVTRPLCLLTHAAVSALPQLLLALAAAQVGHASYRWLYRSQADNHIAGPAARSSETHR